MWSSLTRNPGDLSKQVREAGRARMPEHLEDLPCLFSQGVKVSEVHGGQIPAADCCRFGP